MARRRAYSSISGRGRPWFIAAAQIQRRTSCQSHRTSRKEAPVLGTRNNTLQHLPRYWRSRTRCIAWHFPSQYGRRRSRTIPYQIPLFWISNVCGSDGREPCAVVGCHDKGLLGCLSSDNVSYFETEEFFCRHDPTFGVLALMFIGRSRLRTRCRLRYARCRIGQEQPRMRPPRM